MSGLKGIGQEIIAPRWHGSLDDYITAMAWSPDGRCLAVASAAGEVALWKGAGSLQILRSGTDRSLNCLGFSADGRYLAVGGQGGQVRVWDLLLSEEASVLEQGSVWVEHLCWSPKLDLLAFSLGKFVQVWDWGTRQIIATLPFADSSPLDLIWHPEGRRLTVGGYRGIKIWEHWDEDPYEVEIPSASLAVAWSADGKYLASGNLDRTLTLLQWGDPHPWAMRGFPGKVRKLIWSEALGSSKDPLLVAVAADALVVWEKHKDPAVGWEATPLEAHQGVVLAAAFQPGSLLLASASADGSLCLWPKAKTLGQICEGNPGFSCLSWDPAGNRLAAGGKTGQISVWAVIKRGKGFRPVS